MISIQLKKALILVCVCLMQIGNIQAQDKKIDRANEAYNKFAFIEASKLYQDLVNKGDKSIEVATKLGNCYYFNANYSEAAKAYASVLNSGSSADPEYYFRYAQCLNNTKQYDRASAIIKEYYVKSGKIDSSQSWQEEKLLADIQKQSGRYTLKTIDINTPFSDFGTGFCGKGKVIYSSAKDTGVIIKRKHSWNEKSFLKLYSADINTDGTLSNPVMLKGDVNTRYHQSSPAVTKDGKYMYFTRNNFIDGKLGSDKNGTNFLKIYVAENIKGEWKNVTELAYPINSDGFSSAHPALSADESQLFFVSDRGNKFGDSDIYTVSLSKGKIGNDVVKLGDEINTPGRETYPFVDEKGILYFSSDGHPGLGGLDVFAAMKDLDGVYHVVNLGDDVNTSADDFSYIINGESKTGFFSSNRSGNDDIYGFTENRPPLFDFEIRPTIFGTITNEGNPIADLTVEVFNPANEKVSTVTTDNTGKYIVKLDPFNEYKLVYSKSGIAGKTIVTPALKPMENREISFDLLKEMQIIVDGTVKTIESGVDLTHLLCLNPIYFDYGGFKIRESSKKELDKVVNLMKERPTISIQVNSHTDSRGKDDFNMKLSENRAKSTVDYIIKAGIDASRISGRGYGETRLINKCSNGVPCSEAEHQENRRSEFIVIINK